MKIMNFTVKFNVNKTNTIAEGYCRPSESERIFCRTFAIKNTA